MDAAIPYASSHSTFARSIWPPIHDAERRREQRARHGRPCGRRSTSASRNDLASSRAVRFLPRMCQYIQRSPHIWRPRSQASPSPARAAASSVSRAAWRLASSAMPRSIDATWRRALDAVSDLAGDLRVVTRVPWRRSRPPPRRRRVALRRTRGSSPASGSRPPDRRPGRAPCPRATRARRGSVVPGSAQTASTSANVHPPAKTAMPPEQPLLRLVEQRVAPVDRRAQRLLPPRACRASPT